MVAISEKNITGSVAETGEHSVGDVVVDFSAGIGEAVGTDEIEIRKFANSGLDGRIFEFGNTDNHRAIITYSGEIFFGWGNLEIVR